VKTTITLYPKFEDPIAVVVQYVPQLDGQSCEGYWDIDSNTVALSWRMYKDFAALQKQSEKRTFFGSLKKVSKSMITGQ
jgi:hypothetical protein